MKKILYFLLILLVIIIAAIYQFIPYKISFNTYRIIGANSNAGNRYLLGDNSNWANWWPKSSSNKLDTNFSIDGYNFSISNRYVDHSVIDITKATDTTIHSILNFFPIKKDSFLIQWQTSVVSGYNPLKKITAQILVNNLKAVQNKFLNHFENFIKNTEAVYAAPILNKTVTDTLLLSTVLESITKPDNKTIYQLIDELRTTISKQQGTLQDSAMLNISLLPNKLYKTMVAYPITKEVRPEKNQLIKRLVRGNILVMEKKGGPAGIERAAANLAQFVLDFEMTSPAIPYQKLMTNRLTEKDTSKWVTKFYYPVY
jgi:hypothetical protein